MPRYYLFSDTKLQNHFSFIMLLALSDSVSPSYIIYQRHTTLLLYLGKIQNLYKIRMIQFLLNFVEFIFKTALVVIYFMLDRKNTMIYQTNKISYFVFVQKYYLLLGDKSLLASKKNTLKDK